MARAEMSVVINCPAPDIFAYLTDVANGTEWQEDLVEAQQTSAGPTCVGTTIREVRQFMGRRLESVFKIIEHELPCRAEEVVGLDSFLLHPRLL